MAQRNTSIDVYLIGGQSNATGQGYIKNIPIDFEIDDTVLFYYSTKLVGGRSAMEWGPLCQASETPDKFGVELSMGTTLKKMNPNSEIAIIKHALSGSNLYSQWAPGKNSRDTENHGPEFREFLHTVASGMQQLRDRGYRPKIRAMVWQQGEGDARDIVGMDISRNYGANLHHFIKRLRKQLHAPRMLFLYGYVIPVPLARFTGREAVREEQKNVDQDSGHPLALKRVFVVETDDLPLRCDERDTPFPDDKVHFNTIGVMELGSRFAQKINEQLNKDH